VLDELAVTTLDPPYAARVASLRRLINALTFKIDTVGRQTTAQLAADPGFRAVQALDGVGPVLAAVFRDEFAAGVGRDRAGRGAADVGRRVGGRGRCVCGRVR
jgi:hypothetical protein